MTSSLPPDPRPWRGALAALLAALCVVLPARPAWAVDPVRAAAHMAQQATKAYETADFARAAQLYLEAWRTDPKMPAYLYSAARAEQVGGQADKAIDHYRQFSALPGADAALVAKARAYLDELVRARVDAKVQEAEQEARKGNHRVAAQTFAEAYEQAPDRYELLFKAAVAEQIGGDLHAARKRFEAYLGKAPAGAGDRNTAKAKLDALERELNPQATVKTPVAAGKPAPTGGALTTSKQAETTEGQGTAWAVLGGGVALLAGGAGLFAATLGDADDLDAALSAKDAEGRIVGTSHEEAEAEGNRINQARALAGAVAGVGVVATGVGVWLLLRAPARKVARKVAVVPGPVPAGVGLAVRF